MGNNYIQDYTFNSPRQLCKVEVGSMELSKIFMGCKSELSLFAKGSQVNKCINERIMRGQIERIK